MGHHHLGYQNRIIHSLFLLVDVCHIERLQATVINEVVYGQLVIELCNQRIEKTLAEFNQDDINEMVDLLCTR